MLIDDQGDIAPVLTEATAGCGVELKVVSDAQAAKMSLLECSPELVLSRMELGEDDRAGLKFCQELRDHHTFAEIPVVLFVDKVDESVGQAAQHFGAKAVFPFPVLEMELRRLLSQMMPGVVVPPETMGIREETVKAVEESEKPSAQKAAAPVPEQEVEEEPEEDNLTYSQRILATVLHNLKTSDLLQVVEAEDVPRIVFEMTRTVCEIREEFHRRENGLAEPEEEEEVDELSGDLDKAFGFSSKE